MKPEAGFARKLRTKWEQRSTIWGHHQSGPLRNAAPITARLRDSQLVVTHPASCSRCLQCPVSTAMLVDLCSSSQKPRYSWWCTQTILTLEVTNVFISVSGSRYCLSARFLHSTGNSFSAFFTLPLNGFLQTFSMEIKLKKPKLSSLWHLR